MKRSLLKICVNVALNVKKTKCLARTMHKFQEFNDLKNNFSECNVSRGFLGKKLMFASNFYVP